MRTAQFIGWLKAQFPDTSFYNGSIDKNKSQCVGVYLRGGAKPRISLGGLASTSYATLPITLLVHWTENSDTCEQKAQAVYDRLFGASKLVMGGVNIVEVDLLDSHPVSVGRDSNGISEMTIRLNILYER